MACRPVVRAAIVLHSPALGGVSLKIALPREAADGSRKGGESVADRETGIVLRTETRLIYTSYSVVAVSPPMVAVVPVTFITVPVPR